MLREHHVATVLRETKSSCSKAKTWPQGDYGQAAHTQHSAHTIGSGTSPSLTSSLGVPTATAVLFPRPPAHLEKGPSGVGWDGAQTSFGDSGVSSSKKKLESLP